MKIDPVDCPDDAHAEFKATTDEQTTEETLASEIADAAERRVLDRIIRLIEVALRPSDIGSERTGMSEAADLAVSRAIVAAGRRAERIFDSDLPRNR